MSNIVSRETAYKRINDVLGKEYNILSDDLNEHTYSTGSVELKHITCGNIYTTKITNVTHSKRKCPFCSSNRTYTKDEVVSLLGDEYSIVGDFKGYSKVNKVKHNKCGRIIKVKPNLICNGKAKCHCKNSEHKSSPRGVFTQEEWKTIYGTGYKISNTGKVKNKHDRLLKPSYDDLGYIRYNLFINGKQKRFFAHRLVAKYFIPNPDNLPIVNHIDENPSNPRVDNLQWCTSIYNSNYGKAIIKRQRKHKGKPIYALFDDGTDMYFETLSSAEEYFGGSVTVTHIGHVLDGTQKTTGGLRFELA